MDQIKERKITNHLILCPDHGEVYVQPKESEVLKDYKGHICPICFQKAETPNKQGINL